jgi:hypothetical protein
MKSVLFLLATALAYRRGGDQYRPARDEYYVDQSYDEYQPAYDSYDYGYYEDSQGIL